MDTVLLVLGAAIYVYWAYQMSIAVHGFAPFRSNPHAAPFTRFVVLIPAHDEERVIGQLLASLVAQTYSRELVSVYVSADNCSDDTAGVAERAGARVLVRTERDQLGKTANLRWALERMPLADFDALVLFDADNLVREDFLARMNDHLVAHPGTQAVQSFLETKNPHDSWITRVYALTFWYTKRFWYRARSNARLSINLGGTGSVLRVAALREWGWDWRSLTDDLELTCRIVLTGGSVDWNEDAVAFDEKPISGSASRSQRKRWLQGHYDLTSRYAWQALRRFLTSGRRQYLDLFLFLVAPGRAASSYLTMFGGLVLFALARALGFTTFSWLWELFALCALVQIVLVVLVAPSLQFQRLEIRYIPDVFSYLVYGVRWIPSMISAVRASRRSPTWVRTEHGRALTLDDVQRKE